MNYNTINLFFHRLIKGSQNLALITVLSVLPLLLHSQQKAQFTSINQSNGLVSGDVMCFQQDKNGYMWIGTKYGLNVYDGSNYNVYNLNEEKLLNSDISALHKGSDNTMWIGTLGNGLYTVNIQKKKTDSFFLYKNSDTTLNINCLEYWDSTLWVGTDIGLFKIKQGNAVHEHVPLSIENPYITELTTFGNKLAIGTRNNGLFLYKIKGGLERHNFPDEQINALQSLNQDVLFIGTQTDGLYSLENNDKSIIKKHQNFFNENPPPINEILIDKQNILWIGTDGNGLVKMKVDGSALSEVDRYTYDSKKRNNIASNAIFSLYEDNDGNIWIGTIWKGLSVLNHSPSNSDFYYSDFTGDEPYPVLSIFKNDNKLWFGTDGKGINIIDLETETVNKLHTESAPTICGNYVQTVFKDTKGYYWIGTFSSGLTRLDINKNQSKHFRHIKDDSNTISFNDIRAILEDENSGLWIATWGGGLNYFDQETELFTHFPHSQNGKITNLTDNITSICLSENKEEIWTGTFGNGLYKFNLRKKVFIKVDISGFSSQKILRTYLDNKGLLWMGTWGEGIKVINTKTLEQEKFSALDQVSSSRVTSIEQDNFGAIWFSTKNGIFEFIPSENILIKHGGFDLITNEEFHINASQKDAEGIVYFGGIEGIIAIIPTSVSVSDNIEAPTISGIKLYNEHITTKHYEKIHSRNHLNLKYNQNNITFFFSTPHFPVSDLYYSYQLENLNNDWVHNDNGQITFTNIPPGKYIFKVRSTVNNLQWSDSTNLQIIIHQPLWKRWYAYVVYVSLFILLLFLFQKYAREWEAMKSNLKLETLMRDKEKEIHNIKQRFFTNISHEIRTPVTLILGAANRLMESGGINKIHAKEIDVMHSSSRHLLHLINELLDFRRIETEGIKLKVVEGNFVKFCREIYLSFQTQAYTNNIDYKFISHGEKIQLWFDNDQMEKVTFNLISNAFKYTPSGGTISIEVDQDDQHAFLKVIDSGKGIEEAQLSDIFKRFYQSENAAELRKTGFGLGLSIAKEIVDQHNGEIDASNNVDSGICISVKIPKGSNHFTVEQKQNGHKNSEEIDVYISDEQMAKPDIDLNQFGELLILIVEDNNQLRDYLQGLFAYEINVITAANGEEGLKIAHEQIPDIIISDVMMPVLDGVTMTKKLKTDKHTSHIPIILLTARTNLIYKKEGFEIGADDYITKPFNEVLLRTRVFNILKTRLQLREKLLEEYITKPQEELDISTPDQKFLSDLTEVIENNIHENEITAKLISGELCMSHSVIYKKLKALTGLSLIEFIRDFKLNRAALLLSKYQLSVTDVCYKVGFSDRRYFSRLFKTKFGITPTDYMKKNS